MKSRDWIVFLLLTSSLGTALGGAVEAPKTLQLALGHPKIFLSDLDLASHTETHPSIIFSDTPKLGEIKSIPFQEANAFLTKHGMDASHFGWSPGQTLQISRKSQLLDPVELLDHLNIALVDSTPNLEGELHLEFLRQPQAIRIPDHPFEVTLTRPPVNGIRSRFIIPYSIVMEGEPVVRASAALHARLLTKVLVSARRINRGEALTESDFFTVERDLLTLSGAPIQDPRSLEGLEMKSTLLKDQPLLVRHTGRIPVVSRGDFVDAVLKKGTISITMKVEILDQGAPGDVVRIRNPKSKKQLKGIVTHESTIQIL